MRGALAAIAPGIDVAFDVPLRPPQHDRTKLAYPVRAVQQSGRTRLRMGIFARGTHEIVGIQECRIQARALTTLAQRAERVFVDMRLAPYDEAAHSGTLRAFQARIMPGSGELLLGVVTTGGVFPQGAELARRLLAAAADLRDEGGGTLTPVGVMRNINDAPGNALLGAHSLPLSGRDFQTDRVDDLLFRVSFGSFYQVHRHTDRLLYRPALDLLGDVSGLRIVDGYGGVGCFGLRLAARGAAEIDIVESTPSACRDARRNATSNGSPAVRVIESPFPSAEFMATPDVAIVDPPRAGLGNAGCARLLAAAPQRILHVACSLRALAADLAQLCAGGYRVVAVRLADLFPHTEHVEIVTLLERA